MTPGELALWWREQANLNLEIKVWPCDNYVCSLQSPYPDFPWFKPSPSMPDVATAQFYPGTCIFEGTQLSEGRGTDAPFRKLGAPWINAKAWLSEARKLIDEDIDIEICVFEPTFSKYSGQKCQGLFVHTEKRALKNAFRTALNLLLALLRTHSGKVEFPLRPGLKYPFFDYLCGTDQVRKSLLKGIKPDQFMIELDIATKEFAFDRAKFFLYERQT
jgi:uncharacterized protein YbbC (DUF1343 family)